MAVTVADLVVVVLPVVVVVVVVVEAALVELAFAAVAAPVGVAAVPVAASARRLFAVLFAAAAVLVADQRSGVPAPVVEHDPVAVDAVAVAIRCWV